MFRKLNYSEPSVLRGIVSAVVALATAIGFVHADEIEGAAEVWIPVIATVLPLVQALWTRTAVWSKKSVDQIAGKHEAPEV